MSAERVDGVIASVERHDAALANWMRVAADGLTAGEGEELITQAGLQRYLWYDLPRRAPDDTWRPVVEAAAVLLSLLGLDRYAAIARSATTTAVIDAWDEAPGNGFAAFTAARTYFALLSEVVAHRLLAGPAVGRALEDAVGPIVAAQGWMTGGEPVGAQRAGWDAHRALYHWRLFGLLDEVSPRWEGGQQVEPASTALTPAGRAAARILLRARATSPGQRSDLGLA